MRVVELPVAFCRITGEAFQLGPLDVNEGLVLSRSRLSDECQRLGEGLLDVRARLATLGT